MNGFRYRTITRWFFGLAFKLLAVLLGLVLLMAVIQPLITILTGVTIAVLVAASITRWRIFRHRGW